MGRAVRPHSAADPGYVFAVLVDARFGVSRCGSRIRRIAEASSFPRRSSKDRACMADARRSVHVDDPALPKKSLLPNLQGAATQLVCYSRLGRCILARPCPAAPRAQPATTEKQGRSISPGRLTGLSDCLSPLCHIAAARSTCPAVISLAWLLANGSMIRQRANARCN